jgi:N-acetylglucosaminyldiphosphoundecaprenol N-acetyl-beta-D-mannosaminyltransferase
MKDRVTIFNGQFDPLTREDAVESVFAAIAAGRRGWLCTVNVATLMTMRSNARLADFVRRATWVVADGQPLVWCARLFGGRLPERVAGIDLLDALCRQAARDGTPVFLLGTTDVLLERALARLRRRHPGLNIDGAHGYFAADDGAARADAIRASGAKLLFAGMGSPRQEYFIDEQWQRLGATVAVGVGGSFDVISGARFRAPPWIGKAGLEWVARVVQEPRRLLVRYLLTNSMFLVLVVGAIAMRLLRWATLKH